jgi:protein involved in polysaccharide export with SLBB domain
VDDVISKHPRRSFLFLGLVTGFVLAGCSGGPRLSDEEPSLASIPARLQPGDWIKVIVYGEPSLSGDFQIDQTGSVLLPLAGPTKAAGMTAAELADVLTKRYRTEYVRNPKVTVTGPRS